MVQCNPGHTTWYFNLVNTRWRCQSTATLLHHLINNHLVLRSSGLINRERCKTSSKNQLNQFTQFMFVSYLTTPYCNSLCLGTHNGLYRATYSHPDPNLLVRLCLRAGFFPATLSWSTVSCALRFGRHTCAHLRMVLFSYVKLKQHQLENRCVFQLLQLRRL